MTKQETLYPVKERKIKTQGWELWDSAKENKIFIRFRRVPKPETERALINIGYHQNPETKCLERARTIYGFYSAHQILKKNEGEL